MNAIFTRRSLRKYTNQDVSDEMIKRLLAAAMCAPSAGNERPWHFIVVKNKAMLAQLAETSPAQSPQPTDRYDELRVHYEQW